MSKYGISKYGIYQYGIYSIETHANLSQTTRYRLSTIGSNKKQSRPIINQKINIDGLGGPVKVRLKANNEKWVHMQTAQIPGNQIKIKLKAIGSSGESKTIESSIGTIKRKDY